MHPLSVATPKVDLRASMLAQEDQESRVGSYTSTVRTRRAPLNPPTAYTLPLITAIPHL